MRKSLLKWSFLLGTSAMMALPVASLAQQTEADLNSRVNIESHIGKITGLAKDGKADYRRYCTVCHGDLGDGNGESFSWVDPKPRNFQLGVFKCRSTPTGTLPTDEDLFDTIARGLDRSNMPQWSTFTKQQRADLVAWVKHFSPRFASEKPGEPIQIPPQPEVTAERIKAGRDVFARMQCWKCHGVTGQANGPSAATLTDDLGRPIQPFDFTEGARPKCGSSDKDLYRIFMTGLDGTPMPSFADNVKPDEAWDLVFYLKTLKREKSKEKEIARKLDLKPVDPNASTGQQ